MTVRDEILDAAGELFTTQGYANTSTRCIAEAVGMRQASLYHHFRTKDDILSALLDQTVVPTLQFVAELSAAAPDLAPHRHLHLLAHYDGEQLENSRWNLGALYLMPELRQARLAGFWTKREHLRRHYSSVSGTILASGAGPAVDAAAAELPFRLVESLVNIRAADGQPSAMPWLVADACLRVLGVAELEISASRAYTRALQKTGAA